MAPIGTLRGLAGERAGRTVQPPRAAETKWRQNVFEIKRNQFSAPNEF